MAAKDSRTGMVSQRSCFVVFLLLPASPALVSGVVHAAVNLAPLEDSFVDVCHPHNYCPCARRYDGSVTCWCVPDTNPHFVGNPYAAESFSAIACGWAVVCGVRTAGDI